MNQRPQDRIEILSVDLLDRQRAQVNALRRLARSLDLEFGWHYLLDMAWILAHLEDVRHKRIIDAGAGTGVMQWYLAQQGAEVISVDRLSRATLPLRFRIRFQVQGLRPQDLLPARQVFKSSLTAEGKIAARVSAQTQNLRALSHVRRNPGKVNIYNQDLRNLEDIPDRSIDAVVAVSALEHNAPGSLQDVVCELMRVLKPGGVLLASLNAARDQDWWHEPSTGWCYTDETLRRLFALPPNLPSNYARYDQLLAELRDCAELRDNLARFYFRSEKNGMPWGKWDPQYIPVGVCKVKV